MILDPARTLPPGGSVRRDITSPVDPLLEAGAIALGVGLILVRPAFAGLYSSVLALAAISVALGSSSLGVPLSAAPALEEPELSSSSVVALGVGAVIAAAVVIDSTVSVRIPLPAGPVTIAMNTLAAMAEEAFFRRLVYGGLLRWGAATAIAGSALLFALVHVPLYGPAVFWVDLGAGLVFSWQRWACGDWRAPAATHAFANLMAVLA
jgi:membrane protease YdiL (CAAX protease family)